MREHNAPAPLAAPSLGKRRHTEHTPTHILIKHAPPLPLPIPQQALEDTPSRTLELPDLTSHFHNLQLDTDDRDINPPADEPQRLAPELQRTAIAAAIASVPDHGKITPAQREAFVESLPSRLQLLLNQPFGKSIPTHTTTPTFLGQSCLRNTLLPILKSGYIDPVSHSAFTAASPIIRQAHQLIVDYSDIDFRPLKTHWDDGSWANLIGYDDYRIAMMTACAVHFDLDIPSVTRFIGGPFTAEHRDTNQILADCKVFLDDQTHKDLERIYRVGVPHTCKAHSSEANFRAYLRYGNHKSAAMDPATSTKSILKDFRPGFIATFDPRIRWHTPNMHICPISIQNLNDAARKARTAFDGSFHPYEGAHTINNWTSKLHEPPMTFQLARIIFLSWVWRLRGTYPCREIFPQDDDVVSAHRLGLYHPNMVAMHSFFLDGRLHMYGRMTFGDTTSCPTFDVISRARSQAARYLWHKVELIDGYKKYLPDITIAEDPPSAPPRLFAPANLDELNPSVISPDGSREAPPFAHHVDDNLYADIAQYVYQGLAASKIGLYMVLGFPTPKQPDTFSDEKCNTTFTHERRILGTIVNTRTMMLSLPPDRRTKITAALDKWAGSKEFTLLEACSIFGSMSSICDVAPWAKPYLYTIQNLLSRAISAAYKAHRTKRRVAQLTKKYTAVLSPRLLHRLQPLVESHIATAIYQSRSRIRITAPVKTHFRALADYLRDPSNPWESPIGHHVPRTPFADTKSDASEQGLGFQCEKLKFFGVTLLTDDTYRRCYLHKSDPRKIHINQLEMIAAILGLAAAITLRAEPSAHHCPEARHLIVNAPPCPQWAMGEDNQVARSWTAKNSAKSEAGQHLLRIYGAMLRDHDICPAPYWISSADNWFADTLSRPPLPPEQTTHSLSTFFQQIFHLTPLTKSWVLFLPAPDLLSTIRSALSTSGKAVLTSLPEKLGHFVPAESIASCYSRL